MTPWVLTGLALFLLFLGYCVFAKPAPADPEVVAREEDDANALIWKQNIALLRTKVEARQVIWKAHAEAVALAGSARRANPPEDLHRIVWNTSTHAYDVRRWEITTAREDQSYIGKQGYTISDYDLGRALRYGGVKLLDDDDLYIGSLGYGFSYLLADPPEPKANERYVTIAAGFATVADAETWLFKELHPDENQYGYDHLGRHVADEVVPIPRKAITGLPNLLLGEASGLPNVDADAVLDGIEFKSLS